MDSTGNYIQSLGIEHDGREYEEKNAYVYICVWVCVCIHYAVQKKLTQCYKSTMILKKLQTKKKRENSKKLEMKEETLEKNIC